VVLLAAAMIQNLEAISALCLKHQPHMQPVPRGMAMVPVFRLVG
jgi:hypothetical protein